MPKKWGYRDGKAKIFDLDEDGKLPKGWSERPDEKTEPEKAKPKPATPTNGNKAKE